MGDGTGQQSPSDISVRRVRDQAGPEFRQAMAMYSSSFPANETRPMRETRRMLGSEPYSLWVAGPTGAAHAFALVYGWDGFALLDYVAVERSHRGRGLGSALFAGLLERLGVDVVLLEVQNPDGIHMERDARMRFWRRMGAVTITTGYVLPSYAGEPETMSLMAVFRGGETPSVHGMRRYVEHIHQDVYGYHKTDLADITMRGVWAARRAAGNCSYLKGADARMQYEVRQI